MAERCLSLCTSGSEARVALWGTVAAAVPATCSPRGGLWAQEGLREGGDEGHHAVPATPSLAFPVTFMTVG